MNDHTEFMPTFLLNLRCCDEGPNPYVVSCSIVGEIVGFRGVVRRFKSKGDLKASLDCAGIAPDRYLKVISEEDDGKTRSFTIDLNEAQRLSVIQTDSTE